MAALCGVAKVPHDLTRRHRCPVCMCWLSWFSVFLGTRLRLADGVDFPPAAFEGASWPSPERASTLCVCGCCCVCVCVCFVVCMQGHLPPCCGLSTSPSPERPLAHPDPDAGRSEHHSSLMAQLFGRPSLVSQELTVVAASPGSDVHATQSRRSHTSRHGASLQAHAQQQPDSSVSSLFGALRHRMVSFNASNALPDSVRW